ncbi:TIGR03086 family metal-binding protein [Blastococcus sp. TF02A-26]|uniref:TIGR03086 family metal-binding protein n=1 Tax=Blastococcus sp. TF02A-26 TaxID=2250577 RepID=UPI000DEBF8AF|nr:TIGR03086 family metal-binding protein [Blastococcus sp. TF02A-26]RBY84725.1 TIGR03086 family protein [Blastococcus sp. TF02A-26]
MTTPTLPSLHAHLADAARAAAAVARGAQGAPLDSPTPAGEWDLRTLVDHWVLYTGHGLEHRARRTDLPAELVDRDFAAEPDWPQRYAEQLDRAVAAWRDPAAWRGEIDLGGGMAVPVEAVVGMNLAELVLHGWDVAAATGQTIELAAPTAEAVLAAVEQCAEMMRQYDGFAEALPSDDAMPALERALRLSGRDPHWRP